MIYNQKQILFILVVHILMATIESINLYSRISLEEQTWQSLFEKGKICEEKNDKAEAVLYYQLSLKQSQKMNGTNSQEGFQILRKLASLSYSQNQYSQTLQFSTQLIKTLEVNHKKDTINYAEAYDKLSGSQFFLGHLKDSEKSYQITISLFEKLKGKNSIQVAILFIFLGNVYSQLQQNDKALNVLIKSQQICSNQAEECFSIQLARVSSAKASIYRTKNENVKSFEFVLKSMRILQSLGKTLSTQYGDNLQCLTQLYLDSNQIQEAKERLSTLKDIIKKLKGTQTINYAKVLLLEGSLYFKLGAYNGVFQFCKSALGIIENIYGKESLYTNCCLDYISIAFEKNNVLSQAIKYTTRSYTNSLRFLGESHNLTQKSKQRLDQLKNKQLQQQRY